MSTITELEAALRGTAPQVDADTDGEDVEAFLPAETDGRRTVTFDRSPKRQRVGAVPPATPPHAPRPRPPAPATPEMRPAPAVTQSPPGPPTAGGSSSDDESVPAPRRKWAPPTAGFSSSDDEEEEAPARPADDDTDDGDDAAAAALPAPPPPPPPPPAQTPAQRAATCLERDAEAMGTTPHGFRRMPTLLLAAYRGDAAAVAALPLLFQRREIVIGLGMREERVGGEVTRTRLGSRVVRAPVSDFAMQKTPIDDQNALHLAAGPGEERLAFVVAFLDLVGFETGMHLAMERQRDGVSPAWRARQNKHRHVVELYEPLQRGDRASFMAQLDAARRLVPFEPPQSPPPAAPRAPVVARWVQETRRPPPPRRRRAPSPDSSDGDDGDSSIEWGPVIPAPARRAPPRPIPAGKEIIEIE